MFVRKLSSLNCVVLLKLITSRNAYRPALTQLPTLLVHQNSFNHCQLSLIRCYAKGKDRGKEKNKKTGKVKVNENFLREKLNLLDVNEKMSRLVEQMKDDFVKQLSLRSTTGSIDSLRVSVDGKEHELQELAQISRRNPKTIIVNMIAFPQAIPDVLKAIEKSGMNLNPQQDGTTLFIPIPKVTKEHRENLAKNAKAIFFKYRDRIRDIQQNAIGRGKTSIDISADDLYAIRLQIKSIADQYIMELDKIYATKQKELTGSD